jgi:hypothetical protein
MIEGLSWLALRVQDLARFAAKSLPSEHSLDPMPFVRLGDHRRAHDVPILLRHYVAGEVVPRVAPDSFLCSTDLIP